MALSALNCPNCGGPVQKDDKNCRYCNASINFSPDYKQVKLVGFPCPKCGTPAEKGDRFCSKCAASLIVKCPSCRHDVPLTSVFCPNCRVNFAVSRLIEDAKQKKSSVNDLCTKKEQQVRYEQYEFIGKIRLKINKRADTLFNEAQAIGDQTMWILLGLALGFVLILIVSGMLSKLFSNENQGLFFLIILGVLSVLAWNFYPPIVKTKRRKKMLEEIKDLRDDNTWTNYLNSQELSSMKQKEKETEDKIAALKVEATQEIQKIDEWLKDAVASIH